MNTLLSTWLGRKAHNWYRRLMYHHDYMFTSVLLMAIHTVFCILPVLIAPDSLCSADETSLWRISNETFTRWMMLTLFTAVPLFLDIAFDFFKLSGEAVERNQWYSRLLLLVGLTVPNAILLVARFFDASRYLQCELQCMVIPAQSMILICSVFCTMYRYRTYVPDDEEDRGRKFSIEKRAVAVMLHLTLTRILVFFFLVTGKSSNFHTVIVIANVLILIHLGLLQLRYIYILVTRERRNGVFTSHGALSDFLYMVAAFLFLFCGLLATLAQGAAAGMPEDLAATRLTTLRQAFLVCFQLFVTVIPGRVHRLSAKLEHEKLQTRLNLIRYVSHEMRSPLNTAFLGLEYITDELSRLHVDLVAHRITRNGESFYEASDKIISNRNPHHNASTGSIASHVQRGAPSPTPTVTDESSKYLESSKMTGGSTKSGLSDVLDIVKQINASCNIALYTLNDLLTFDKLDEKKLEVELQPVNAWHFALETAKPFKINAKESKVDFTISCTDFNSKWYRSNFLRADEFKLSQVLRNLISNALKFTPAMGKVHMVVEMLPNYPTSGILHNGSTLGSLVRIAVTDTGPGISKANLHKLFGQYVQFNPSKLQKGGGSGLGLWISKSIVELHGGTVRATSEGEGFGCTFIMELPLFQKGPDGTLSVERPTLNSFGIECIPENEDEQASMHASTKNGAPGSGRSSRVSDIGNGNGAQAGGVGGGAGVGAGVGVGVISPRQRSNSGDPDRDLESGQGGGGDAPTSPSSSPNRPKHKQAQGSPQVASPGVMSWLFRAGGNVKHGAQQFLNQNVTIVTARSGKGYFAKQDPNNLSGKNLYHLNQDYDSAEGSGSNTAGAGGGGGPGAGISRDSSQERIFSNDHAFPGTVSLKRANSLSMRTSSNNNSSKVVPFDGNVHFPDIVKTVELVAPEMNSASSSAFSVLLPAPINTNVLGSGSCDQTVDTALTGLPVGGVKRSWTAQLRFLAVDDTALNRKMMGRILCSAGHVVEEAGDGTECLQLMNCPYRDVKVAHTPHTPHTPHSPKTPKTPSVWAGNSAFTHPNNSTTIYNHINPANTANTASTTTSFTPHSPSPNPCTLNLSFDAILMDENMPLMSGPEAASWLRKAGYQGIIIGVTGDCYEDQMEHFVSMGANVVLPKPLKLDKLRATLEALWKESA